MAKNKKLSKKDQDAPINGKWLDSLWDVRRAEDRLDACKDSGEVASIERSERSLKEAKDYFRKLDESY